MVVAERVPSGTDGRRVMNERVRLNYYYCHECKEWTPTTEGQWYFTCDNCGELIQCDECGEAWTNGHECLHD